MTGAKASCDIEWFAERDIDVWLAEELRLNAGFCRWLLALANAPEAVTVPAIQTRVSVLGDGRETDVEAVFEAEGRRLGLLIEDKLDADFQPGQMRDYFKRGEAGVRAGRWDAFRIVVFAPAYKMIADGLSSGAPRVTFEAAADFLEQEAGTDARMMYRADFLRRAANPRTMIVRSPEELAKIQLWWSKANGLLRERFGNFLAPQTPTVDTYVSPRWDGQPSYLRLDIKGRTGEVLLMLKGFDQDAARAILAASGQQGFSLVVKPGWTAPGIAVTGGFARYTIDDDLDDPLIAQGMLAAYDGAWRLFRFWQDNRDAFERAAPAAVHRGGS